ncbi:MAG TPA: hypothetical protein PKN96_07345 [Flavobacterium sp.]|uniref:hypothetical protein n=1 Tax=Flavobacterium sp. TaxID=239 RepID=UPI002CB243DB|nr:hypothetical protein [Flavobacterium sp.]HNP33091.1 hypothetical protein [Flavobacterium sp.]
MSKITPLLFFLISGICFSQTKLIHGKVLYLNTYQENIDIINFNSKYMTQTNNSGDFTIEAKVGDVLIFMSERFVDQKYKLTSEDFKKPVLTITLVQKPIPLNEVEIAQVKAVKVKSVSYNDVKMAKIQKDASRPKVEGVYTGEMVNGVDFIQIGKMIGKLFKSDKSKEKKTEVVSFKDYAKSNFNESFFSKTLKVAPEDTARFIEYCDADPKSKTVIATDDELTILEFLLTKKAEFDKLK